MNKLSLVQQVLLVGFCVLSFGYLVGSFISISFNVAEWSKGFRAVMSALSIIASGISMGIYADVNK